MLFKESRLPGYNAVLYSENQTVFLRNIMPPSTGWKSKPKKKLMKQGERRDLLPSCFEFVICLAYLPQIPL
jgi:hypothetical protein